MTRATGAILIALALCCALGCGERAVDPEGPPGDTVGGWSWTQSPSCEARRDVEGVQCDPRCLERRQCVRRPEGRADECVECLSDAHCRVNPFAWGPRCDPTYHVCVCASSRDCNDCYPGRSCMATAMLGFGPVCGCATLGPTPACPAGAVCNGIVCQPTCRPQDCKDGRRCDERPGSPTHGLCVQCLGDGDCGQDDARPRCVAERGVCGCNADGDCAGSPSGSICRKICVHHPGIAGCDFRCGCGSKADCPADAICHQHHCEPVK